MSSLPVMNPHNLQQARLAVFLHGYRRGICDSAIDELIKANNDFMLGFRYGQIIARRVRREASIHFGGCHPHKDK